MQDEIKAKIRHNGKTYEGTVLSKVEHKDGMLSVNILISEKTALGGHVTASFVGINKKNYEEIQQGLAER